MSFGGKQKCPFKLKRTVKLSLCHEQDRTGGKKCKFVHVHYLYIQYVHLKACSYIPAQTGSLQTHNVVEVYRAVMAFKDWWSQISAHIE